MVFICAPLLRRVIQLSLLTLTWLCFWTHTIDGRDQDPRQESVCEILCLGHPLLGHLQLGHIDLRGPSSLLQYHPLLSVWMGSCPWCLHQWELTDKMFWAAAMIAVFLILLRFLHCLGQAHYKLLCHALDSIGVISLGTFFFVSTILFQVHHLYCRSLSRLGAFQLLLRKEAHHLRLGLIFSHPVKWWFHFLFLLSLPCCLEIIRICLFLCKNHHVSAQLSSLEENVLEWHHKNLEVSQQAHTPVWYCLFVIHVEMKEFLVQSIQGLDIVVMFIQYGKDIIQCDVHPQAPDQLPWVTLQGTYDVGEKDVIPAPSVMIHC